MIKHAGKTFLLVGFIFYEFNRSYLKRTRDGSVSNWSFGRGVSCAQIFSTKR